MSKPATPTRIHKEELIDQFRSNGWGLWTCVVEMSDGSERTGSVQGDEHCTADETLELDPCDHQWEHIDASFDHEFGTEQVHYSKCKNCGETTHASPHANHDDE